MNKFDTSLLPSVIGVLKNIHRKGDDLTDLSLPIRLPAPVYIALRAGISSKKLRNNRVFTGFYESNTF